VALVARQHDVCSLIQERADPPIAVTSVKQVYIEVEFEMANGQAAMGGSLAASASSSGGASSAIPSICM
jgi:hypothetical protein